MTNRRKARASGLSAEGEKVLLMGSSKYSAEELPPEVKERLDAAMDSGASFIVAEARGSCRLF